MATDQRDYRIPADPMVLRAADALYDACEAAILGGRVDSRSPIGDATLDYRDIRFNDPFALGCAADDAAAPADDDVPVERRITRAIRAAGKAATDRRRPATGVCDRRLRRRGVRPRPPGRPAAMEAAAMTARTWQAA